MLQIRMSGKFFGLWAAALAVSAASCSHAPKESSQPPLIPRAVILEESERGNPTLSPDGTLITYSAPVAGVPNIWIKTVGKDDDRPLTEETKTAIDSCSWQADSRHILYFKDQNGDENTHLYQTDIVSGQTRDLTPFAGAQARALILESGCPDELLVHLNARDRKLFDIHRLDLRTGALRLDTVNPGDVSRFYADHRLRVRAADVKHPDNSAEVRVRDDEKTPWRPLLAWGADEMDSDLTGVVGFSADDAAVLVVTSLGANAERLLEVKLRTGERAVIGEDSRFDVVDVMIHPVHHTLEAVAFEKERITRVFFDKNIQADFEALGAIRQGDISIRGRDRADKTWIVRYAADDHPTAFYLYDRASRKAAFLFSEDPKLETARLAKMNPIQFTGRDGSSVFGYLTLPAGSPAERLPLIVLVHGGPWIRDSWGLHFPVQCLANRGYAVLQVNFRGSTGYGKAWQNAGDLQWGGDVLQDLVDGKNWAVSQGFADPRRVAIMGGSFGGYAALAALAFRPGEFSCGIAMNAISDANLLLETMPPYWTVGRARFEMRMGKDPDFLREISPLTKAGEISAPLLLIHNANDVRVVKEHSDRMAAALRASGKDVTYLLFPEAGHLGGGGTSQFHTRWAAIESFLAKHLGGRAEPPSPSERWEAYLK